MRVVVVVFAAVEVPSSLVEDGIPWVIVDVLLEELRNVKELDEGLDDTKLVLELYAVDILQFWLEDT